MSLPQGMQVETLAEQGTMGLLSMYGRVVLIRYHVSIIAEKVRDADYKLPDYTARRAAS